MDGKKHFVVEAKSQLNLWQGSLAAAIIDSSFKLLLKIAQSESTGNLFAENCNSIIFTKAS